MDQHTGLAYLDPRLALGQPLDHCDIAACGCPGLPIGGKLHARQLDPAKQRVITGELACLERRTQRGDIPLGISVQVFGTGLAVVRHIELAAADNPIVEVETRFSVGRHEPAGSAARMAVVTQHVIVEQRCRAALGKISAFPLGFAQGLGRHHQHHFVGTGTQAHHRGGKCAEKIMTGLAWPGAWLQDCAGFNQPGFLQ